MQQCVDYVLTYSVDVLFLEIMRKKLVSLELKRKTLSLRWKSNVGLFVLVVQHCSVNSKLAKNIDQSSWQIRGIKSSLTATMKLCVSTEQWPLCCKIFGSRHWTKYPIVVISCGFFVRRHYGRWPALAPAAPADSLSAVLACPLFLQKFGKKWDRLQEGCCCVRLL